MDLSTLQQIAVSLSAIIATATFIYKVGDDRKSRKEKEILDWQKTVVHSIFQKNAEPWLSFEHIINKYRGEAADVPGKNLPQGVLTSAALRKILISMVSERIIDQRGGDQYQLLTLNRDDNLEKMMSKAQVKLIEQFAAAIKSGKGLENLPPIDVAMAKMAAIAKSDTTDISSNSNNDR